MTDAKVALAIARAKEAGARAEREALERELGASDTAAPAVPKSRNRVRRATRVLPPGPDEDVKPDPIADRHIAAAATRKGFIGGGS